MIDLHMHTIYSDGASLPNELVQGAITHGLEAIAVTDHDTTESLSFVMEAAAGTSLEIIPGIEINTHWKGKEVHVLGYYIDPESRDIQGVIKKHRDARLQQLKQMVDSIRKKTKIAITFDEVLAHANSEGSLGRPHVAQTLLEKGGVSSIGDAFKHYLGPSCSTYVERETVTPHEAAEAIYESGGIAVIAHPGDMVFIEDLVKEMMNYGLRGLEAYHRSHSPALIEFHCSLAEKYNLIVTGGTDFHGPGENYVGALSRFFMPDLVYQELKAERKRLQLSSFKAS
ncbi:MAG: PHP domain-containing protein [Cyanobacteria bacterium]|nr:PHP domain-containing protein [Cyanobacteriota bacterium]